MAERDITIEELLKSKIEKVKQELDNLTRFLDELYSGKGFVTDTQAHYMKEKRDYLQKSLDILNKEQKRVEKLEEKYKRLEANDIVRWKKIEKRKIAISEKIRQIYIKNCGDE